MDIYAPPRVKIVFAGATFSRAVAEARLVSYDKLPGEAVGSAVVEFSAADAGDFNPAMGALADIYCGGAKVFAGYVVDAPAQVGADSDVSRLVLADIKGLLRGRFIGEDGIGDLEDGGFACRGYQCVFNRGGFGDKDAAELKWGGTAAWRCVDIIQWIFTHYVPPALATGGGQTLDGGWLREPADLDLTGSTVLAAIDTVAQLAGESWDLRPRSGAAHFTRIAPGMGDVKTVRLFQPGRGAQASDAGEYHATAAEIRPSVAGSFDKAEAHSAPGVIETTFGTGEPYGSSIVKVGAPGDKKFVMRFRLDVTTYAARKAGLALTATCRPKEIMPWLVTRLSAAGAAATPPYTATMERMKGPIVWIVPDTTVETPKALRVDDGYRIDLDWSVIDFEQRVGILAADGAPGDIEIADWDKVGVYLTAAVRIEDRQTQTAESDAGLPLAQKCRVNRPDMVPEWRWKSVIPADNENGWELASDDDEPELCVDCSADLAAAAAAALASAPSVQYHGRLSFATVPNIMPGDRVRIKGRTLPAGGASLPVVDVRMGCVDGMPDDVEVSLGNAPVALDPQNYLASRRPAS